MRNTIKVRIGKVILEEARRRKLDNEVLDDQKRTVAHSEDSDAFSTQSLIGLAVVSKSGVRGTIESIRADEVRLFEIEDSQGTLEVLSHTDIVALLGFAPKKAGTFHAKASKRPVKVVKIRRDRRGTRFFIRYTAYGLVGHGLTWAQMESSEIRLACRRTLIGGQRFSPNIPLVEQLEAKDHE